MRCTAMVTAGQANAHIGPNKGLTYDLLWAISGNPRKYRLSQSQPLERNASFAALCKKRLVGQARRAQRSNASCLNPGRPATQQTYRRRK